MCALLKSPCAGKGWYLCNTRHPPQPCCRRHRCCVMVAVVGQQSRELHRTKFLNPASAHSRKLSDCSQVYFLYDYLRNICFNIKPKEGFVQCFSTKLWIIFPQGSDVSVWIGTHHTQADVCCIRRRADSF